MSKDKQEETKEKEGVVEIDENGNIYQHDGSLLQPGQKTTILRDPEGEYS